MVTPANTIALLHLMTSTGQASLLDRHAAMRDLQVIVNDVATDALWTKARPRLHPLKAELLAAIYTFQHTLNFLRTSEHSLSDPLSIAVAQLLYGVRSGTEVNDLDFQAIFSQMDEHYDSRLVQYKETLLMPILTSISKSSREFESVQDQHKVVGQLSALVALLRFHLLLPSSAFDKAKQHDLFVIRHPDFESSY